MLLMFRLRGILMLVLMLSAVASPAAPAFNLPASWSAVLREAEKSEAQQLVVAITSEAKVTSAEIFCLEIHNGSWSIVLGPMDGSVGRMGIADPEKKREGDGCSPYGVYPLGMAFGYEQTLATKMPYRQMNADDIWVDDPAADDYNRLVKIAATKAKSFEYMRRKDDLYAAGLVVEYNTDPVVPGNGSAIFVHSWRRPFWPTAGCLGLAKNDLATILSFLDPQKKPAIAFIRKDLLSK